MNETFLTNSGKTISLENAIKYGDLDDLAYIRENNLGNFCNNGRFCNKELSMNAAKYGHVKCLEYVHRNGSPISNEVCKLAAMYGHIECLMYAHKNGGKLDKNAKKW